MDTVSYSKVDEILAEHKRWLDTEGESGECADFSNMRLHGINFIARDLRQANFEGASLGWSKFSDSDLEGANFENANLNLTSFRFADLRGANFKNATINATVFETADLRQAKNLPEAPVIPNIHQTVFETVSQPDALDMEEWHSCKNTHCRAGWVCTLAGKAGKDLEDRYGTGVAAALIYYASDPTLRRVPSWADSNEIALMDMERLALLEKTKSNEL